MKKRATFFATLQRFYHLATGNKTFKKGNHSFSAQAMNGHQIAHVADFTEIKNTEQQTKESDEKYSLLFEQAFDGFGISDFKGYVLDVNESMCRISGYSKEELVQMHVTGFIDPEDLKTTPLRIDAIKNGERVTGLRKLKRKDGRVIEVEINAQKLGDDRYFTIVRDLTEIRAAERKTALSEATFSTAFEHSAFGMALVTIEGVFIRANKELCKITGYSEAELCELNYRQITHPDDVAEGERRVDELQRGFTDVYKAQKRYIHKNGKIIWANLSLSVVRRLDGLPNYMVACVEDITKQMKVSNLLQEREEQLRLFIHHSPASLAMFDKDMRYLITSKRWVKDYGLVGKSIIGKTHYEVFPEINDEWKAIHKRCLAGAIEKNEDDFFIRENGTVDWLKWEIHPWHKQNGEIGGIIMFTELTTHTKEAELKFRSLTEQSSVGVHIIQNDKYVYVNPMYAEMFGMQPEEMINKISPLDLIIEEDHPVYEKHYSERLDRKTEFVHYEVRGKKKNGDIIWIEAHGSRIQVSGKTALIGSFVDITKRKVAELQLKENEEKNRLILNAALDCIISIDANSIITYWNRQACIVFGWAAQEAVGKSLSDMIIPEQHREAHKTGMARYLASGQEKVLNRMIEINAINRSGAEFPIELTITPVKQNGIITFTAFIRDITNRKKAENEIRSRVTQLQNISDNLPDTILYQLVRELNGEMRFVYISNGVMRMAGISPEAILSNANLMYQCIDESDRQLVEKEERRSYETMTDFNVTVRFRLFSGEIRLMQIRSVPRLLEDGRVLWDGIQTDITEQQQRENEIKRLNRLYYFISQANDLLLRSEKKEELFAESCRIAVEYGGVQMAWVGVINEEENVVPVAWAGNEDGYLQKVSISIDPNKASGRGPTGRAIRSHTYYFCNDIATNPDMGPWRTEALERGYQSSISYPIIIKDKVEAVFTIYVTEPGFFNETEIKLLQEVTDNIAFTLDKIQVKELHKKAEFELRRSEETNRAIVNAFPDKIFRIRRDGVILDYHTNDEKSLYTLPQTFKGKSIPEVLPTKAATALMTSLENAFESNQLVTVEYVLPINEQDRYHEGRIVAMTNGEALLVARDITRRKMANIEIEKRNYEIKERMKELKGMYQVSELSTRNDISVKQLFEQVIHIIPPAYQYPEVTCARISYADEIFVSDNFQQSKWMQQAVISVGSETVGKIEVYYTEERPDEYEGVFLKEETELINSIAQMLGSAVERRTAITELVESEEKFRSLVEQDYVGVYILQDKAFVYVNQGFEKISAYTSKQLINNMSFEDLIHSDDLHFVQENYNLRVTGKKDNDQYVIKAIRSDGVVRHIELIVSRLMYKGTPAIIGTIIDVTDRVEEETRIALAITETQERERLEMGMELHDNVKQILAISQLHIDIAKQHVNNGKDPIDTLNKTREFIGEAIFEIRRLSHQLAPVVDAAADFCEVIKTLLENINHDHKLKLELQLDCLEDISSREIQLAIYRIIQEQFANIKKHADAKTATIVLDRTEADIVLLIKDDGKGFEVAKKKAGIGLENIKRRAQVLGGSVQIKSKPGQGCEMMVWLKSPLSAIAVS
jgi:PAS domain S-box-containing protein